MIRVLHGDCLDLLRGMGDNTVDAICTDPPYGLTNTTPEKVADTIVRWVNGDRDYLPATRGFMGSAWDAFVPPVAVWDECLRVLKPGGHVLTFAAPRTQDLMTLGLRLAGFEIRDSIAWIQAQGFPKSRNVSADIDKAAGVTPEVVGTKRSGGMTALTGNNIDSTPTADAWRERGGFAPGVAPITAPVTDTAKQWQGWGTALRPAHEPIIVARKPLAGTVASNVAAWGTGAINIDATRVSGEPWKAHRATGLASTKFFTEGDAAVIDKEPHTAGRWPSNLILSHAPTCGRHLRTLGDTHCRACNVELPTDGPCEARCVDGCPVAELDQQSSNAARFFPTFHHQPEKAEWISSQPSQSSGGSSVPLSLNSSGTSDDLPVFKYQPKAPARERPKVKATASQERLGGQGKTRCLKCGKQRINVEGSYCVCPEPQFERERSEYISHPTVKPLALCRWMVRLVTPPGGTVLDMFAGSGTTGEAAALEGFDCILIEREPTYLPLIAARLERAGADHDCPTIADTPQDDEEQTA